MSIDPDQRDPVAKVAPMRAGILWMSWMMDLCVVSCVLLAFVESRDVLDIAGVVILLVMAASTIWTRTRFGMGHRPRLRDGFHTVLMLGCFLVAMELRRPLGLDVTATLASASVTAAFTIAAATALFAPASWLHRP